MGKMYHLDVGCGDASVIISSKTFLIDCYNIGNYEMYLPKNKMLRGVFITHQHSDHYSGLKFLKEEGYSIEYLIYSPYIRRRNDSSVTLDEWREFGYLKNYFKEKGSKIYSPYKQSNFDNPWWENGGLKVWVLGPKKTTATSDTRELHDACLVLRIDMGSRKCLFTGDASDANLRDVSKINHNCDDILHASHHGSINGADLEFIKSANADYTVVSTKSGVHSNVPHPTAMDRYRKYTKNKVYRTDSGTITWSF